jgi:soluble lytic murein transglycosylase-like protein
MLEKIEVPKGLLEEMSFEACRRAVHRLAAVHGVSVALIEALVTVESNWNPWAFRYEPGFMYVKEVEKFRKLHKLSHSTELNGQRTSWGLMQIMGGTARDLGYVGMLSELLSPEIAVDMGIRYFKTRCARYTELEDQIAAYNAGSARKDALTGKYINQKYVDRVLNALL